MKRTALALGTLFAVASLESCSRSSAATRAEPPATEMQTIDTIPVQPAALDPPPILTDEGPAPKVKIDLTSTAAPVPADPEDEKARAALPFAPAMALDPVSGMKIPMKANTIVIEFKNHLYYFENEANKRTFLAAPDQYTKGVFAH